MVKKRITWPFYLVTFVITALVFISGVYFGFFLNRAKSSELQEMVSDLDKIRTEQELNLLLIDYLPNKTCDIMRYELEEIIPRINELEKEVTFYEDTRKFEESSYMETKKDYMINQIKYWLYMEKLKSSCDLNVTTLIYFYSNRECDLCRNQGIVLDYMKNRHKSDLMIFALDTDLGMNSIEIIRKSYGIETLPALIVNEKIYGGFVNRTSLEEIINQTRA